MLFKKKSENNTAPDKHNNRLTDSNVLKIPSNPLEITGMKYKTISWAEVNTH